MKKIFVLALALVAVLTAGAQDAKTLFDQAKKLDDTFKKGIPSPMNPNATLTPEAAKGLLEAMDLYQQVIELDQKPNEKGQVKPKYTDKIMKSVALHAAGGDFARAGGVLFNAGMKYPEAYQAFMLSGSMAAQSGAVDSIYAVDFYNAGNCAFGTDFEAAQVAYEAARKANIQDPQCFVYEIASLQNIANQDTAKAAEAQKMIREVSGEAVKRFGNENDYIFNNYLQGFIDDNDYEGAMALIDKAIAADPNHDNFYRLRGLIHFTRHDYKTAAQDFLKMSEVSNNYNYLREAADYLNDCGKRYLGTLDTVSAAQKAEILDMYNKALQVAAKAAQAPDAQSMDGIIEDINYNIENANNL